MTKSILVPTTQIIQPSGARTSTQTVGPIINPGYRGAWFTLNVTAGCNATDKLNLRVNIVDPSSGGWVQYSGYADITANGTYRYVLYPGASSAGSTHGNMDAALPASFSVSVIHYTAASITYSLGAHWIP